MILVYPQLSMVSVLALLTASIPYTVQTKKSSFGSCYCQETWRVVRKPLPFYSRGKNQTKKKIGRFTSKRNKHNKSRFHLLKGFLIVFFQNSYCKNYKYFYGFIGQPLRQELWNRFIFKIFAPFFSASLGRKKSEGRKLLNFIMVFFFS